MKNGPLSYCRMDTPLGEAVAAARDNALIGFWFVGQKYFPQETESWVENADGPVFPPLRLWLRRYFAGEAPVVDFALAPRGTPFQEAVWGLLLEIPYGSLTTYGAMARKMAVKMGRTSMSAQAVGGAVGHNPISILIPCHRVVGSSGDLTGYAGGIDKKTALLRLEGAMM